MTRKEKGYSYFILRDKCVKIYLNEELRSSDRNCTNLILFDFVETKARRFQSKINYRGISIFAREKKKRE